MPCPIASTAPAPVPTARSCNPVRRPLHSHPLPWRAGRVAVTPSRKPDLEGPGWLCQRAAGLTAASLASDAEAATSSSAVSQRGVTYTSFEGNSWEMAFSKTGVRMLVDPWLVGDLTFADSEWLYKGTKSVSMPSLKLLEAQIDFLLISQGLPDHAHIPTLQQLSKDLPVVASPSAAAVSVDQGFVNVRSLRAGDRCTLCDGKISVRATEGALVGPPWATREAGFIVTERLSGGVSMYYEPHCDYVGSSVRPLAPVDVVVSPVLSVDLGGFPLVKGDDNIVELLRILKPSVVVPLLNNSFDSEGWLSSTISSKGALSQLPDRLTSNGLGDIRVVYPQPVVPLPIDL